VADLREVSQGIQYQGVDEEIIYSVDTALQGGTPTSVSVVVFDASASYTDVTSTVMPVNSPTVATDTITLSPLKLLTEGQVYRVEIKFTSVGNVIEVYFQVWAQR